MTQQIAGFPYWEIHFDENANFVDQPAVDALLAEVPGQNLTDLFVFSHGWNNDVNTARDLYERFFTQLRQVLDEVGGPGVPQRRAATIGVAGVIWPSMRWIDEDPAPAAGAGAADLVSSHMIRAPRSDEELVLALKAAFVRPEQQRALDELAQLLKTRPANDQALARFQSLMKDLTPTPDTATATEDNGEQSMFTDAPRNVFSRFAAVTPSQRTEGGAAGLFDPIARVWDNLWEGAKTALRQATYWEMKKRGGVIGQKGLGPLLGRVQQAAAALRLHLVGHSFGARLVSFALAGLETSGSSSPVKSILLLQGAFSHFAFADSLPFSPGQGGALAGMAAKVDGPLAATHSLKDSAVTVFYPLASFAAGDAAAGFAEDFAFHWGGMGCDGAQAVSAQVTPLLAVGQEFPFEVQPGQFVNLDGNSVIVNGGPPSGAHSDIVHPEIAWAALVNAGIAGSGTAPSSGGAASLAASMPAPGIPTPQPGVSPSPAQAVDDHLLRAGAISGAFAAASADDRKRAGLHADDRIPGPVMVELNLRHVKGLPGARERFQQLFATITGHAVTEQTKGQFITDIANTYCRCELSVEQVRRIVKADQAKPDGADIMNRAIYRIWPDFPVHPCIDCSISTVKADAAQRSYDARGAEITWAVIDSGIDAAHPHFATYQTLGGDVGQLHWDFTIPGQPLSDRAGIASAQTDLLGHGTHVAGIIAGSFRDPSRPAGALAGPAPVLRVGQWFTPDQRVDSIQERKGVDPDRLRGVAPTARLISLRVLAANGQSYSSNVIRALQFVREELNGNGKMMRVQGVNLSLGYEFDAKWFACGQSPICVEVDRLVRSGVVVVIASGNTGYGVLRSAQRDTNTGMSLTINDPGNAHLAITVGATHRDSPHTYGVSYFSSKGPTGDGRLKPDLVAPGERITSCAAGQKIQAMAAAGILPAAGPVAAYLDDSGTSMAAPHVSGAIAAFLSIRREYIGQPEKVKKIFLKTATSLGRERYFEGHGLVDLMRALQSV